MPKLRFQNENGNDYLIWEKKKLGDTVAIERGASPRPIDIYITDDENGCNWIKIGDAPETGNRILKTKQRIIAEGIKKTKCVYKGDLILSNSMSFGKPYILDIDGCIHDGWLLIKDKKHIYDVNFLCYLLGSEFMLKQYKQLAAGTGVNNLNKELVGGATVFVPCLPEQQKIANFLTSIDELIQNQEQKVSTLELYNKGLISKIFQQEIRFLDDNGNNFPKWEEKSVEKFIEEYNVKTTINNEYPILSSTHSGIVLQNEYFNKQTASEDNTGYKIVPTGYFTYRAMSDTGKYVFNQQTLLAKGIVSPAYPVFKVININETFFRLFMNKSKYVKSQILMNKEGSTRFALSISKLKELKINHPCLEEQQKISNFLSLLDEFLHSEKEYLEKLKTIKKALLQQMFV